MSKYIAVAIDGPAGAGKTTQAKALAKELGYTYVDTGALYRAFAIHKIRMEERLQMEVSCDAALDTFEFEFVRDEAGNQRVKVCGEDVTDQLRTPEVSMVASTTSAFPAVRAALLEIQKKQALSQNVVMEGRDIGTVVLPDAQVKIFLTADSEIRAKRRVKELRASGQKANFDEILAQIKQRDYQDSHREVSPLKQADDAILVDCTCTGIEKTTNVLLNIIKSKLEG